MFKLEYFLAGLEAFVIGWGQTNSTPVMRPDKLQVLKVNVVSWLICKKRRPQSFRFWHLCAGVPIKYKEFCKVITLLKYNNILLV